MLNPLDKKLNVTIGELLRIGALIGAITFAGYVLYAKLKTTAELLEKVNIQLEYIHGCFKEAAEVVK